MSARLLKQVMEQTNKTVINVASDTNLGTTTVLRYLKGESVNRSTESLLEQWVKAHSNKSSDTEVA